MDSVTKLSTTATATALTGTPPNYSTFSPASFQLSSSPTSMEDDTFIISVQPTTVSEVQQRAAGGKKPPPKPTRLPGDDRTTTSTGTKTPLCVKASDLPAKLSSIGASAAASAVCAVCSTSTQGSAATGAARPPGFGWFRP